MTLALSLKVNDGIVLASDSATTVYAFDPATRTLNTTVYNNANKLFNLIKGLPVGAITWGIGSLGQHSIPYLVKDFRSMLLREGMGADNSDYSIEDIANRFHQFIYTDKYVPANRELPAETKPYLGFIIAGYSRVNGIITDDASLYRLQILGDTVVGPESIWEGEASGITWNGQQEAISRVLLGFGTGLPIVMETILGVQHDLIEPAMIAIKNYLGVQLLNAAMPLQDAIDLAEFLVDLTIKYSKFTVGPQTVGGAIELAAITKHEGFKWVQRKHYYNRVLNPES